MGIAFRPLQACDLRLLHEWLNREHVACWWHERDSYEDVVARYGPAIDGRDPTDLYFVVLDGRPIGFVETYLIADYPEWDAVVQVGAGVAGMDLFIAEEELIGKGIGTEVIRRFTQDIVFAREGTLACVADPDVRNLASIRAFEKAGYARVRDFFEAEDGELHALVRLDRHR